MYRPGHLGVSLLVWAPIGFALASRGATGFALLGGGVVLALASLPDVDHDLPLIEHRGITHTLWFALAVGAVVGALGWGLARAGVPAVALGLDPAVLAAGDPALVVGGFGFAAGAIGILAHLLGDALTPAGVPLLWPFSGRSYTLGLWRADDGLANYGLLALGAGSWVVVVLSLVGL